MQYAMKMTCPDITNQESCQLTVNTYKLAISSREPFHQESQRLYYPAGIAKWNAVWDYNLLERRIATKQDAVVHVQ